MKTRYIKIDFLEAQFFMAGGIYSSKDLHYDAVTDDYFIPENEYNKLINNDPYKV